MRLAARAFSLVLKGLLVILLLVLLAVVIDLASRPPRTATTEQLFQGVTYTRIIWSTPRNLVIHVVEIELAAPGIRVLVTPGNSGCGMETCAMTTSEFLKKNDLQLAINGSFFAPFEVGTTFWDYYPQTNDPTDVQGLAISNGVQYSADLVTSKNGVHTLNAPIHTRIPMRQRPVANHLGVYALPLP